jgi:hypothetical protein
MKGFESIIMNGHNLSSGLVSLHFVLKLSSYVTFVCICLNSLLTLSLTLNSSLFAVNYSYLCLHLLKIVFRRLSREHLAEGFGLSVVTKTTPPLPRKRLSMYALSRERV